MKLVIKKELYTFKSIIFILFMCYETIVGFLNTIKITNFWSIVCQAVIVTGLVFIFFISTRRDKVICIGYIVFLIILLLIFPKSPNLYDDYALPECLKVSQGFIGFYLSYLCINNTTVKRNFMIVGVVLFANTARMILNGSVITGSNFNAAGYNMAFGFYAMLPCVITWFFAFTDDNRKRRIAWLVMAIALTIFITMYGSRGPLLSIISIAFLTYGSIYLRDGGVKLWRKVMSIFAFLIAFLLLLVTFDQFLILIENIFSIFGLSLSKSRTLIKFLNGTGSSGSGRDLIWNFAIEHFNFVGHGAFSDQYLMGVGNYCHDFFIEVIFDFGYFFGIILIACFLYTVFIIIKQGDTQEIYSAFIIFLSYFVGRLILSGTFWTNTYFWMLIGIMVKYLVDTQLHRITFRF